MKKLCKNVGENDPWCNLVSILEDEPPPPTTKTS